MVIEINDNKLHKSPQTINVDKVLTLIGENGCGKSSILESIFNKALAESGPDKVICFSSGQNESYSENYKKHLNKSRSVTVDKEDEILRLDNLKTFYFDHSWSKVLIFIANAFISNGLTRSFLKEKYITTEKVSDVEYDNSTVFEFSIKVDKRYIDQINMALKSEEVDPSTANIRKSKFNNYLTALLSKKIKSNYEYEEPIPKTKVTLKSNEPYIFWNKNPYEIISFFSIAANGDFFIDINDTKLMFNGEIRLEDLSDGEYQLLVLYSLIDIFDDSKTLFLLDEIDSHLFYKNIEKLWDTLQFQIKGTVITTTHLLDSIVLNEVTNIKLVEKGLIKDNTTLYDIIERLDILSEGEYKKKKIAAKVEYIALVEDRTDWVIFTELAKKALGTSFNSEKFSKIHPIKCSCGYYRDGDDFGKAKKEWVAEFAKTSSSIQTKEVFLICDRDILPIGNMYPLEDPKAKSRPECTIEVTGAPKESITSFKTSKYPHLLAWRRREIENYFITFSILNKYNLYETAMEEIAPKDLPRENEPMDGVDSIRDNDFKPLLKSILYKVKADSDYDIGRWDYAKLHDVIDTIPSSEISQDIVNMYTFIVNKVK